MANELGYTSRGTAYNVVAKALSVSKEYLQVYLDEFTFRFNRRRTPMAAFQRVLRLGSQQEPTTHEEILAEGPGAARRAAELNG